MSRKRGAPLKPKTVMTIITVSGGLCLAGIGYIWAKTEVHSLSRSVKVLELRLEELKRDNAALERDYARLCSPALLDQRVKELKLGLAAPQPDQIIRLTEPLPPQAGQAEDARTAIYAQTNAELTR